MKKKLITFILLLTVVSSSYAQYAEIIKIAKSYERQGEYYKAIVTYNAANVAPDKPTNNNIDERINYCGNQLNLLKTKAENAKKEAIEERKKADNMLIVANSALAKAEEMQLKVETAMFDKAVNEQNPEWKGFAYYYQWEQLNKDGKKILEKIDTLNLSSNALLRLPKEVVYCPNLKSLNLFQNDDIKWTDCFEKLSKLTKLSEVKVSIYDLDSIPKQYWSIITSIEMLQGNLSEIPQNILQQKQLIYFDVCQDVYEENYNFFSPLPAELFELTNLQYLNLSLCDIKNLPSNIENFKDLIYLNLKYNDIESLPNEIGNLTNLNKLDIAYNELINLPEEIRNLTNLSELNLSNNELTGLPSGLENLKNLKILNLTKNKLITFSNEIGNLTNLSELYLNSNEFTSLPSEIENLTNLSKLYLSDNQFTSLPLEVGSLTNLIELNLEYNQLTSLSNEIGNLSNLTFLNLKNNNLTVLPAEIGNLTKLMQLNLYNNAHIDIASFCAAFADYPREIVITTNEWDINIDKSKLLITIPKQSIVAKELGNIKNLAEINFTENKITSLPVEIGNLTNLSKINFRANQLTVLPNEFENCTNLTHIDFSWNKLSKIPKYFGNFSKATFIDLSNNKISKIPTEITNLSKLLHLNLQANEISSLPKEIGSLTKLIYLSLSVNYLTYVPNEIGNLTNLLVLDISQNRLQSIPKEIGKLKKLEKLYLSFNELDSIPNEIQNLTELTELYLSGNHITTLPKGITKLTNLMLLDLSNNPYLDFASICNIFANYDRDIIISTHNYALNANPSKLLIIIPKQKTIPREIGNIKNLIQLNIWSNKLISLPEEIKNLTKLESILCGDNNFSETEKQKIKQWLPDCYIDWNYMEFLEDY